MRLDQNDTPGCSGNIYKILLSNLMILLPTVATAFILIYIPIEKELKKLICYSMFFLSVAFFSVRYTKSTVKSSYVRIICMLEVVVSIAAILLFVIHYISTGTLPEFTKSKS